MRGRYGGGDMNGRVKSEEQGQCLGPAGEQQGEGKLGAGGRKHFDLRQRQED